MLSRYWGQLAVLQRVTSVELPGQVESTVTGFCLMQVRVLVENPLLRVMQPLVQVEGRDHSDQDAELLTPGLTVFLTQEPGTLQHHSSLMTSWSPHPQIRHLDS